MTHSVCAITITFNPELAIFAQQLEQLAPQCDIVIVDNGSRAPCLREIERLAAAHGCHLIALAHNEGIAAAQNHALSCIMRERPACEYVLFLDHDSVPDADFVASMIDEFTRLRATDAAIGVLGPVIYEPRADTAYGFHVIDGLRYRRVMPDEMPHGAVAAATINSAGTFCPLEVVRVVGLFDADLFIDHVETEWCFRAAAAGYRLYGTRNVTLEHRMGDNVVHFRLPGRTLTLPYRSPLRHRYLMRNSVAMLRRPYIPRVWKAYCAVKIVITFLLFGFMSDQRSAQARAIIYGIGDGIRGRFGMISN